MLFFLFLAVVDMGVYCYSLISVQDGARMVAIYASSSIGNGNNTAACQYLLSNLAKLPNLNGVTNCAGSPSPVTLTITSVTDGPDHNPAVTVTVAYKTLALVPVNGLPGQLTITRSATARRRS
jgi:Flp pilus assembly protein TadG